MGDTVMKEQAMYAITVTARGQIVDSASFSNRRKAEQYKADVRRWAMDRRAVVQVWTQNTSALSRAS